LKKVSLFHQKTGYFFTLGLKILSELKKESLLAAFFVVYYILREFAFHLRNGERHGNKALCAEK